MASPRNGWAPGTAKERSISAGSQEAWRRKRIGLVLKVLRTHVAVSRAAYMQHADRHTLYSSVESRLAVLAWAAFRCSQSCHQRRSVELESTRSLLSQSEHLLVCQSASRLTFRGCDYARVQCYNESLKILCRVLHLPFIKAIVPKDPLVSERILAQKY